MIPILSVDRTYAQRITSMQRIARRMSKCIETNFDEQTITGAVVRIMENGFLIANEDRNQVMRCITGDCPTDLVKEAVVKVTGRIDFEPKRSLVYFRTESYSLEDQTDQIEAAKKVYKKLQKTFDGKKGADYLKPIHAIPRPDCVRNVGLIVPPNSETILRRFLSVFQSKCGGNIFVHYLTQKEVPDFGHVLEYFSRYRRIDAVCILLETISNNHRYLISSLENVRALRAHGKYVASIVAPDQRVKTVPSVALASTEVFYGIQDCVKMINENQADTYRVISNAVDLGKKRLAKIISHWKKKLQDHQIDLEMLGSGSSEEEAALAIQTIKPLLLTSLARYRTFLEQRRFELLKSVLNIPEMVDTFRKIGRSETQKNDAKKHCDVVDELLHGKKHGR